MNRNHLLGQQYKFGTVYFISFIMTNSFILVNLLIATVVDLIREIGQRKEMRKLQKKIGVKVELFHFRGRTFPLCVQDTRRLRNSAQKASLENKQLHDAHRRGQQAHTQRHTAHHIHVARTRGPGDADQCDGLHPESCQHSRGHPCHHRWSKHE
mmetsp:Transcript_7025/g.18127  ORF Transcript_7025/g.18127 Transcript_7025/m.18127 type:complete len:154 (-) Transcript_7025:52-513(-)